LIAIYKIVHSFDLLNFDLLMIILILVKCLLLRVHRFFFRVLCFCFCKRLALKSSIIVLIIFDRVMCKVIVDMMKNDLSSYRGGLWRMCFVLLHLTVIFLGNRFIS